MVASANAASPSAWGGAIVLQRARLDAPRLHSRNPAALTDRKKSGADAAAGTEGLHQAGRTDMMKSGVAGVRNDSRRVGPPLSNPSGRPLRTRPLSIRGRRRARTMAGWPAALPWRPRPRRATRLGGRGRAQCVPKPRTLVPQQKPPGCAARRNRVVAGQRVCEKSGLGAAR